MGAGSAAKILFKNLSDAQRQLEVARYQEQVCSPVEAAELGYLDDIIRPQDTRAKICHALRLLRHKRMVEYPKKHDNLPL